MEVSVLRHFLDTNFDSLREHGMVIHTHEGETINIRPYSILDLCEDVGILYIVEFIRLHYHDGTDEINNEHSILVSSLESVSVMF